MQVDRYLGITNSYTSEYKASGSKFYGFLFPVNSPMDFDERIKAFKHQYSDATHVCSACVIGLEREYQRFSDDGEPSNSSGRPILHALLSKDMTYVGCAVVRYYGGKKLGIPGLIEAYGGAAQLCIETANIDMLVLKDSITCNIHEEVSYYLYNYLAKTNGLTYSRNDNGQFEINCAKSMTPELLSDLKKLPTLAIVYEK
ncbi:YigZ family protein [Bacteroidia bacterium]|nr:YigZ family protein [Bacteroidia bacterium]